MIKKFFFLTKGREYAEVLAKRGLNMLLISRTEAKLDAVMREIKQKHGVKVQVVVADFTEQNIYERIDSILSQLDVGILINNVGIVPEFALPHQVKSS